MIYVGAVGVRWRGNYSPGATYFPNDLVTYLGSTYMASSLSTANVPTNGTFWEPLAVGYTTGVDAAAIQATKSESNAYGLAGRSTSTSPATLTTDGAATVDTGSGANVIMLPQYSSYLFELKLAARRAGASTLSQGWSLQGMVSRDAGAPRLVGSVVQVAGWNEGTSLGTVNVAANTTGNYLEVTVTPSAATPTAWNGRMATIELTLAS